MMTSCPKTSFSVSSGCAWSENVPRGCQNVRQPKKKGTNVIAAIASAHPTARAELRIRRAASSLPGRTTPPSASPDASTRSSSPRQTSAHVAPRKTKPTAVATYLSESNADAAVTAAVTTAPTTQASIAARLEPLTDT
jgi:hypothetical protein